MSGCVVRTTWHACVVLVMLFFASWGTLHSEAVSTRWHMALLAESEQPTFAVVPAPTPALSRTSSEDMQTRHLEVTLPEKDESQALQGGRHLEINLPERAASPQDSDVDLQPEVGSGDPLASMDTMMNAANEVMHSNTTKAKLQRKRISYMWVEQVLQKSLDGLAKEAQQKKMAAASAQIASETDSPATAAILSKMRGELQTFSAPLYQKGLEEEIASVQAKQKALLEQIVDLDDETHVTHIAAGVAVAPASKKVIAGSEPDVMHASSQSKMIMIVAVLLIVGSIASAAYFVYTKTRSNAT